MNHQPAKSAILAAAIAAASSGMALQLKAQSLALEEVIVTAQKREQSLQDVGIAISAFDGQSLEAMGVANSNEIAAKTPNLTILSPSGEGGVVSVFVRGIGLNDFALNNTGPIGFYIDESSIGSSNGQLTTLFDIERVEVLKGPQGTLFGRNTTGGALNIVSYKPTEEFEGSVKLSAGNFGYYKAEGVVSGSLHKDVNARLALTNYHTDGYEKNLSNGETVKKNNFAGRLLLDYVPTDDLNFLLNVHGSRNDSDSDLSGGQGDANFYEGAHGDRDFPINVDTLGVSLKSEYEISDGVSLTSITAYDDLEKLHLEEADMTPLRLIDLRYHVNTHTFSQELRLNGFSDKINWIAGLYYLAERANWSAATDASDLVLAPSAPAIGVGTTGGSQKLETSALFGQLEYALSEQWALTVGGRYTRLNVDFEFSGDTPGFGPYGLPTGVNFEDELSNGEFSGKVALNYFHNDDVMYYGSITRGFKGGGFNGGVVSDYANYPSNAEYDPEILTAYELGLKSSLLEGSLRLNAATFYYDYEDAQVFNSIADPVTQLPQNQIENAKSLELYGLDIEATWQPADSLFIQAGIGYTHSEFDSFDLTVPQGFGATSSVSLAGETPQNTPKWNLNLLANYSWSLDNDSTMSAQIDSSYQSEVFFSNGTVTVPGNPASYIRNEDLGEAAYSLWNARLAWVSSDSAIEIALWGKNLADKEYVSYMFELSDVVGRDQIRRGTPRTYGVDFKYYF